MKLFKTAVKSKQFAVILSEKDYSFLNLYCLAKGYTKAKIIRDILKDWQSRTITNCSEAYLLQTIAARIRDEGKVDKKELQEALFAKGLLPNHIQQILKYLHLNGKD